MNSLFWWILGSGILMSTISLVGGLTLLLHERSLQRLLLPMVAFSAGALMGGAFFHMLPEAIEARGNELSLYVWLCVGFVSFFVLEQFLHWHHCHRPSEEHRQPLGYLLLVADGIHNLMGGLAVGGAFVSSLQVGVATWLAAAAHEVPQEFGEFGVLVHGGWSKGKALFYNFLSALPFLLGALLAYGLSATIDVTFLLPLAAGNFLYIAAADLVPEVNKHFGWKINAVHFASFTGGLALLYAIRVVLEH